MTVTPADQVAIEALVHRHAFLIDHGRASHVAELYTHDARLYGIGPDKIGRAAIAEWAAAREAMTARQSRHVQTNILLERAEDGHVRGTVVLTLYRHDGQGPRSAAPILIGEYHDLLSREPDGAWRFVERRLVTLFGDA